MIGDDYLVTNADLVEQAAAARAVNAVLLKVNQAGTVSETFAACQVARRAGFGTIVSARSGETEDFAIAHLAVGWDAGQLKVGSFARSERMAKWNEVLRIEEALGAKMVRAAGRERRAGRGVLAHQHRTCPTCCSRCRINSNAPARLDIDKALIGNN
ncbi:hypothetical protein [Bradyrhizobium australafricanum]|uniref:hypothetical protein n=1 Tax=Bradyrhizobium australafricanum TaxID=2821406 RepID=UPI0040642B8F